MAFLKKIKKGKKIIIFVGMEGWSKKGGQGDYIRELSDAISAAGHLLVVVNPYFRQPHSDVSHSRGQHLFTIDLPMGQGSLPFDIYYNKIGSVHYFRFKDPSEVLYPIVYPEWYIAGSLYSDSLYGYIEAVALSRISMHLAKELEIKPDIIHFNDWQAAYGPPYLEIIYRHHNDFKSLFKKTGTVITTHNIAYQGLTKWGLFISKEDPIVQLLDKIFPANGLFIAVYDHGYGYEVDAFALTGFPRYFQFLPEGGAECWGDVPGYGGRHNVLKFGIEKTNKVVAVSKGSFHDMQRHDLGFGLGPVVANKAFHGAVSFVWNGVETKTLSPNYLKELTEIVDEKKGIRFLQFDSKDKNLLDIRAKNKIAVRARINKFIKINSETSFGYLDEQVEEEVLVCAVSRLVRQKGYGILLEPLEYDYELGIYHGERLVDVLMRLRSKNGNKLQLLIMGTPGDENGSWLLERLKEVAQHYKGQVAVIRAFDQALANQIRSGSDIFFMPSQYEPGGISNIQAAVLGALCVLTYTGGLIDFIEAGGTHLEFVAAGFAYELHWTKQQTGKDFVRAFTKALNLYYEDKKQWKNLVKQAMTIKADWSYKVPEYMAIYKSSQDMVTGQ